MSAAEVVEARSAYEALSSLNLQGDPRGRAELLTSGIAVARVDQLYPVDFEDLAPKLLQHYQATGTNHLRKAARGLEKEASTTYPPQDSWPQDLLSRWMAQYPQDEASDFSKTVWELVEFLDQNVAYSSWQSFPHVVWHAWWLMANREILPPKMQLEADRRMLWVSANLLPNLRTVL